MLDKREKLATIRVTKYFIQHLIIYHYHSEQLHTLFIPSSLRGLDNVSGNVGNIILRKTSSEGRHGVLSVGNLGHDSLLVTSSSKVLFKGLLLKSLVGHDNVLSSSVASSAVGVENGLSGGNISSEGRSSGDGDGNSSSGGSLKRNSKKERMSGWKEVYIYVQTHVVRK